MLVGGYDGSSRLSNVELFPPPASDSCFIPDLPHARADHSFSLLSGGRLVVCGAYNYVDSCISWVAGNNSWTLLYTMRCVLPMPHSVILIKQKQSQCSKKGLHGLDSGISSRIHCAARWRSWCNKVYCRDCTRYQKIS